MTCFHTVYYMLFLDIFCHNLFKYLEVLWHNLLVLSKMKSSRLQELEEQYRKEREEASNLLEQQRLVSESSIY